MSGESEPGPQERYSLESYQMDWSEVIARQEEPDRWSFTVHDREQGRKIGHIFAKDLDAVLGYDATQGGKNRLEDPDPIEDCRLTGGQISFTEYDDDLGSRGPITLVELYIRNSSQDPEGLANFQLAINSLLAKSDAKSIT